MSTKRSIVPVTTSDRHAVSLDGSPPSPPIPPGGSIRIEADTFGVVLAEIDLLVSPSCARAWRIDQILIDGVPMLDAPRSATSFVLREAPRVTDGAGCLFEICATNTSDAAAHFFASFVGEEQGSRPPPTQDEMHALLREMDKRGGKRRKQP